MTKKFQALIDRAANTGAVAYSAQKALHDFCEERYGVTMTDIDCDFIIDSVLGGCGAPSGMSASDFDRHMIEAAALAGVTLKDFEPAK